MISSKVKAMYSGGSQVGGAFLVVVAPYVVYATNYEIDRNFRHVLSSGGGSRGLVSHQHKPA